MVELYRKVNKSKDNLMGFVQIPEGENPFTKPCLVCLSAQTGHDKSVFGAAKVGAAMARCRVRGHYMGGLDIESMPISFLASRVSEREESASEFVDTYLVPLVFENGQRINVEEACRRIRNVNFLTYCDGILKTFKIEEIFNDRLTKMGYTEDERNSILKNIFVLSVATNRHAHQRKMSVAVFRDVLDDEVNSELDRAFVEQDTQDEMIVDSSPNCHYYLFKGDGEHDFKKYAFDGRVSALISLLLMIVLNNSVNNSKGEFVSLELDDIFGTVKKMNEQHNYESMISLADSLAHFDGVTEMTKGEAQLRDELDEICVVAAKRKSEFDSLSKENRRQAGRILAMQKAVGDYCSKTTALRILLEACGWQVNKEQLEEIMNTPSDKEVIEGLDKAKKK